VAGPVIAQGNGRFLGVDMEGSSRVYANIRVERTHARGTKSVETEKFELISLTSRKGGDCVLT
jgi:hypothetical protein